MMTYVVTSCLFYVSLSKLGMYNICAPNWIEELAYIHSCDLQL